MCISSVWDPLVLRKRHVVLCGFPFSSLNVTASSKHAEKKVMWACKKKKICQYRREREKKKRKREGGRSSVSTPADNTYQGQRCALQQTTKAKWADWQTHCCKSTDELLIFGIIFKPRAGRVYHWAWGCFCTADFYQHLYPLLNSWHQKVVRKAASNILFETRCKHNTPPKLSTSTWFISK